MHECMPKVWVCNGCSASRSSCPGRRLRTSVCCLPNGHRNTLRALVQRTARAKPSRDGILPPRSSGPAPPFGLPTVPCMPSLARARANTKVLVIGTLRCSALRPTWPLISLFLWTSLSIQSARSIPRCIRMHPSQAPRGQRRSRMRRSKCRRQGMTASMCRRQGGG